MIKPILQPLSAVNEILTDENDVIFKSDYMKLRITPVTNTIVRVTATREDAFAAAPSHGVCYQKNDIQFRFTDCGGYIKLDTADMSIHIDKSDTGIKYYDAGGKLLFSETKHELEQFEATKTLAKNAEDIKYIDTPDGKKAVIENPQKVFYKKLYRSKLSFELNDSEAVYGFGQYTEGTLNLRHCVRYVHHANMQIALPLMVSTNGYGILFDMYCPMIFDDTGSTPYLYAEGSDALDFYFIKGTPNEVIAGYRYLSGKASLLPKWAYGYVQSAERYETQDELIDTLKKYRSRKLGIDCIVLDWQSWSGNHWGDKNLDTGRFPNPEEMMKSIHDMNGHLMVSIWPNMASGKNHDEMAENGYFLPNSNIYNAFLPKARELYWKQANEGLYQKGIDAFWCDSSEPFTPEWGREIEPPPAVKYRNYVDAFENCGTIDMANAFSLYHSQSVYDGMRKSEKRALNLTRSGYIGQQKYGAVLWSGDTSATWDVFRKQIAEGLSLTASGYPWWTLDIGGFFTKNGKQWHWSGDYNDGANDLGYRELYVRWYQFAAFLPMFRAHGTDTRRELWAFGSEGELFYDVLVKYNRLRYALMPTIYSIAAAVWKHDVSFFTPLSFAFCEDMNTHDIKDQFMVGDSIMVCPVTEPMYYTANSTPIKDADKSRTVYLPGGTGWYDFHTNMHYNGGQTITVAAELDIIPLFVREGAIILTGEAAEYAEHNADKPITITVYSGQDGHFEFYEDSGDGYGYETGAYTITDITWTELSKSLDVSQEHEKGQFRVNVI